MAETNLKIKLKFFPLSNGKLMQARLVSHENIVLDITPNTSNIAEISVPVVLPVTYWLEFSNKDHGYDTVVDSAGSIIEDLHVEVLEIALDCFNMPQPYLRQNLELHTVDGKVVHSNYIGFNGKMSVALRKSSVFQQIMQWSTT